MKGRLPFLLPLWCSACGEQLIVTTGDDDSRSIWCKCRLERCFQPAKKLRLITTKLESPRDCCEVGAEPL